MQLTFKLTLTLEGNTSNITTYNLNVSYLQTK